MIYQKCMQDHLVTSCGTIDSSFLNENYLKETNKEDRKVFNSYIIMIFIYFQVTSIEASNAIIMLKTPSIISCLRNQL